MKHERPVTQGPPEITVSELEAVMASGALQTQVDVSGSVATLERNMDGGFTMTVLGQAVTSRVFPRSALPAPGFPPDLPFVENEVVMVSAPTADVVIMVWLAPTDPEATCAAVAQQMESQGWRFRSNADIPEIPLRRRTFENGPLMRELIVSKGVVTLICRP